MRPSITLSLLLGATLSLSALACRGDAPSGPEAALDIRSGSSDPDDGSAGAGGGSASSDSSASGEQPGNTTGTVDGPARPDTAVQTPPLPASFTLQGFARGAVSTSDTTVTVPLGGVTANLYRVKTADGSPVEPEVLVGSTVADANGEFAFRDVPSAYYRLDVKAPSGGVYQDASRTIVPPWSSTIGVYVVLPRKN